MSRLDRVCEVERRIRELLRRAHAALREATLDIGSAALDRAALGAKSNSDLELAGQHLMGLTIPRVTHHSGPPGIPFGITGTSANTVLAMLRFMELPPLLAALAELQNAVLQLARELRKTQRRCNALSKIFIPSYHETLAYISGTLEERERESLTILKIVRDRLAQPPDELASH